jgi:L-arabinonolactonase
MQVLVSGQDDLGECPLWDVADARLRWIDVTGRRLSSCELDGSGLERLELPEMPGSFSPRRGGGRLIAYRRRLALGGADGGEITLALPPEFDGGRERFNDGACDPQGRFWVGTMDRHLRDTVGALYRVGADLSVHRVATGYGLSNGLAWSPDGKALYHCDSRPPVIYRYDFDGEGGEVSDRRVFVAFDEALGIPDGCATDEDGFLWVAAPEAGKVLRFDPQGRLERSLATPAAKPSSLGFGGPDRRHLFITSIRTLVADPGPLDGAVFVTPVATAGVARPLFAG